MFNRKSKKQQAEIEQLKLEISMTNFHMDKLKTLMLAVHDRLKTLEAEHEAVLEHLEITVEKVGGYRTTKRDK